MEYRPSDSSGTDDDLPQFPNSRSIRGSGRVSGNGRALVPASSYARAPTDMEAQIQQLEQEAYCSVLRAFKAQSDAITWEKEGLMTELRKELRVSDKAHRELLNRVNNDNIICSIREWRSTGGLQAGLSNNPQPIHDPVPSPTTSGRKRQKTSQSVPALPAPPLALHSQQLATPTQPSSSTARKAVPPGPKGKKMKPKVPGGSAAKPMSSSAGPSGRGPHMNRNFPGGSAPEAQAQNLDPLVGRKVMSRWPEDNSFYEAVISDYNAETGLYALVYDINTANETWEWVDLKEMGPEDIRWQEDDSGIDPVTYLRSRGAPTSGVRKPTGRGGPMPGSGRGRGLQKNMSKKDFPPPQNGVGKRSSDDIDILHTESLIKEVEKVFSISNPDPQEVEKAKKALKEQEQSLIDAIARLAEASDGESDGHNRGRRNLYAGNQHQANYIDAMPVGDQADAM
ncbi:protein EMSY-LIKE 3 isoform X2 [Sorghum bicolor]|uniref:protein EMSY-LIKE 3 isoform X2 n=1 Tax=Sorghum bicolor TaxID=4558 RepID=UPI000B424D91|nr:protein EMSY-LIKE 3 isoform X2 [Sorghum bicolor]|eukprot:XP_021308912.1 protein EMSY-LIKE 3 isoform X2 [Sorghum bicolor]